MFGRFFGTPTLPKFKKTPRLAAFAAKIGETLTESIQLTIEVLILERSAALRLGRSYLVRRAGFKNLAKGFATAR